MPDDTDRLCHPKANTDRAFIVRLYRLSKPGALLSGRDWSVHSRRIVTPERIARLTQDRSVTVYYAVYDKTGTYPSIACRIKDGSVSRLSYDVHTADRVRNPDASLLWSSSQSLRRQSELVDGQVANLRHLAVVTISPLPARIVFRAVLR